MAIANADHGTLLLTADLLHRTGRIGLKAHRLDDENLKLMALRFPPIEDVVKTLDHIAARETAA